MIAEVFVAMFAAHHIGDYWVQTNHQAANKEFSGWACAGHVGTYMLTQSVALALLAIATGWTPGPWGLVAGFVLTAGTHFWADRRFPLRWLARLLGKEEFWHRGGAPLLDQAWHIGWLLPAALLIGA